MLCTIKMFENEELKEKPAKQAASGNNTIDPQ
jgi:hypothetical protein